MTSGRGCTSRWVCFSVCASWCVCVCKLTLPSPPIPTDSEIVANAFKRCWSCESFFLYSAEQDPDLV